MGSGDKFQRLASGIGVPGTTNQEGQSPSREDMDQAQRALSVASGSQRFGPLIPTIMSLASVDNPAALNPDSVKATRSALDAVRDGSFEGGAIERPGAMGIADKFAQSMADMVTGQSSPGQTIIREGTRGLQDKASDFLLDMFGAQQDGGPSKARGFLDDLFSRDTRSTTSTPSGFTGIRG
jgi:hypothetical protein